MASEASNGNGQKLRKISTEEIQKVQSMIEKCLQMYMNQTEVITALHRQAKIEPGFTSLVWQKLEQQNPDFFKAYNTRLRIKEQITAFNYLVSQQVQLMQKSPTTALVGYTQGYPPQSTHVIPGGARAPVQPQYIIQSTAPVAPVAYANPQYAPLVTALQNYDPNRVVSTGTLLTQAPPLSTSQSKPLKHPTSTSSVSPIIKSTSTPSPTPQLLSVSGENLDIDTNTFLQEISI